MLRQGYYQNTKLPMKYYHLPTDPPMGRHKWFYGVHEAEIFLEERGKRNGMEILQLDREKTNSSLKNWLYRSIFKRIVHRDVNADSLWSGSIWAVLAKR